MWQFLYIYSICRYFLYKDDNTNNKKKINLKDKYSQQNQLWKYLGYKFWQGEGRNKMHFQNTGNFSNISMSYFLK